jgi:hypothetical protein
MTHNREERKRQEKQRARQQMGTRLGRAPPTVETERWPRIICGCGAEISTVNEALLCPEGHTEEVA